MIGNPCCRGKMRRLCIACRGFGCKDCMIPVRSDKYERVHKAEACQKRALEMVLQKFGREFPEVQP